jgi:signal transduction histidine kinase
MPDVRRWRTTGLILLLAAGFLVLVAISAASVLFVNKAREDSGWVVHTVEVESQIANLLLDIRRTESATRAYMLTSAPQFLSEQLEAAARIIPAVDHLAELTRDNPYQAENTAKLKAALQTRLSEFARGADRVKNNNVSAGIDVLRNATPGEAAQIIDTTTRAMRVEEDRLFALRTENADRSQKLASTVTIAGSAFVVMLAGLSVLLVRRSTRERDAAEERLRENNANLEVTVDKRTADLREANNEIQRFAYIVSHDLRSPLVNIMGFTSELEELRNDIFRRIASLAHAAASVSSLPLTADDTEPSLEDADKQLSEDFSEALGFIKSSIGKMDRLITAILNLTREGRRQFEPTRIDTRELIETVVSTIAHQAAEADATIHVEPLPAIVSDRLALEQIFSNLIDNAIKYLKPGTPGEIFVRGRTKLGFAIFEVRDNGRGIDAKDHQRIFDLFRRAGTQDKPGQGIGLAHVRALVRRLGGTMSVASELNKGSTFTITLPVSWSAPNRNEDS